MFVAFEGDGWLNRDGLDLQFGKAGELAFCEKGNLIRAILQGLFS